jgi:hypothetical protein
VQYTLKAGWLALLCLGWAGRAAATPLPAKGTIDVQPDWLSPSRMVTARLTGSGQKPLGFRYGAMPTRRVWLRFDSALPPNLAPRFAVFDEHDQLVEVFLPRVGRSYYPLGVPTGTVAVLPRQPGEGSYELGLYDGNHACSQCGPIATTGRLVQLPTELVAEGEDETFRQNCDEAARRIDADNHERLAFFQCERGPHMGWFGFTTAWLDLPVAPGAEPRLVRLTPLTGRGRTFLAALRDGNAMCRAVLANPERETIGGDVLAVGCAVAEGNAAPEPVGPPYVRVQPVLWVLPASK